MIHALNLTNFQNLRDALCIPIHAIAAVMHAASAACVRIATSP